jgi:hypothetical protein
MRVKTLSRELEFGGLESLYIKIFGMLKAPPSYCTIYFLDKGGFFKKKIYLY